MRITIIGTGYVGLVSGACLADMGNTVVCVDIDREKIDKLSAGVIPIYEPGLETLVLSNISKQTLRFTIDMGEALEESELCFIAVGTPQSPDGQTDLSYVLNAAEAIGRRMSHPMIIVNKSTVPVGTADQVRSLIQTRLNERKVPFGFTVVSNPEFLKEGSAIDDFMHPDRVIVGADDDDTMSVMHDLYAPFMKTRDRFIGMDIRSAEMTKYAANAMLASRISFMNEIANLCELVGADVNNVRIGIGSDSRIGYSFIYPGCGYGGSCFPKDIRSLAYTAREHRYIPKMLDAIEEVNNHQKHLIARKITYRFGEDLSGKTFAVWGLAFKPQTDDMREASSITILRDLIGKGASIRAYDPEAMEEARKIFPSIVYVNSKYDALTDADALILITEWKEFRSPDFDEISRRLKHPILFDGRNQYKEEKLRDLGFEYHQIGVGTHRQ